LRSGITGSYKIGTSKSASQQRSTNDRDAHLSVAQCVRVSIRQLGTDKASPAHRGNYFFVASKRVPYETAAQIFRHQHTNAKVDA